jgi:hypothetical protein
LNVGAAACLLRVGRDERGVDVDDQRRTRVDVVVGGAVTGQPPRRRASLRAGGVDRPQRGDRVGGEPVDRAGHRRVRRHQPVDAGFGA